MEVFRSFYEEQLTEETKLARIKAHGMHQGYNSGKWITAAFFYAACYSDQSAIVLTDSIEDFDATTTIPTPSDFDRSHARYRKTHWIRFIKTVQDSLGDRTLEDVILQILSANNIPEQRFSDMKRFTEPWFYFGDLAVWDFCEALNAFLPQFPVIPSVNDFRRKGNRPWEAALHLCGGQAAAVPAFVSTFECVYTLESALCRWHRMHMT